MLFIVRNENITFSLLEIVNTYVWYMCQLLYSVNFKFVHKEITILFYIFYYLYLDDLTQTYAE